MDVWQCGQRRERGATGFRVNDNTNAFDRLAGHVVVAWHGMGGLVKIEMPELPWGSFAEFGMGTQFEPERECASLGNITERFNNVSEVLLAFLTMHETYRIGQLGLLKKCMSGTSIMA